MNNPLRLGSWVLANAKPPITHLKLQKLCFYCFGAALAIDAEDEVGADIVFEPWNHGPVLRALYKEHREAGASALPAVPFEGPAYSPRVEEQLKAALRIYERLSAWELREESHRESPWVDATEKGLETLDPKTTKAFFKAKFGGPVRLPEALLLRAGYGLDGASGVEFESLSALAAALE